MGDDIYGWPLSFSNIYIFKKNISGIYSVFELSSAFGALFLCLLLFNFIAGASNKIHCKLLHSVMRSPMSFFDTNPTGRIINRFTTDIDTIDNQIPHSLLDFFWSVMSVIGKGFFQC